jgi:hypothetical protein
VSAAQSSKVFELQGIVNHDEPGSALTNGSERIHRLVAVTPCRSKTDNAGVDTMLLVLPQTRGSSR